jgi:hypothetical protein
MWDKWADDRLPNGQFKYGPVDLANHARRLEQQRDELMDALEECREAMSREPKCTYWLAKTVAEKALATVKGEQP